MRNTAKKQSKLRNLITSPFILPNTAPVLDLMRQRAGLHTIEVWMPVRTHRALHRQLAQRYCFIIQA